MVLAEGPVGKPGLLLFRVCLTHQHRHFLHSYGNSVGQGRIAVFVCFDTGSARIDQVILVAIHACKLKHLRLLIIGRADDGISTKTSADVR